MTGAFSVIFVGIILMLSFATPVSAAQIAEVQRLAHDRKTTSTSGPVPVVGRAPEKEQCLEGVCLGDSIRKLIAMPWLELEDVPQFQDPGKSFPVFHIISYIDAGSDMVTPYLGGRTPTAQEAIGGISGLSNPDAFLKFIRGHSDSSVDLGRSALLMLADSGAAFCKSMDFSAYFRSKSGHATTVRFAPIAL